MAGTVSFTELLDAYKGELAGLAAAACWAITSLIFNRVPAAAGAITLFKNVASCCFLFLALLAFSLSPGSADPFAFLFELSPEAWACLGLSSLAGLVIGDTFYFRSLQILGPRRTLAISTLTPPLGVLCGWLLLGSLETLPPLAWGGMALTLVGVIWIIREKGGEEEAQGVFPGSTRAGIWYGLLGCAGQAAAAGLAKIPMNAGLSPLKATFARMLIAIALGAAIAAANGKLSGWVGQLKDRRSWLPLLPASFLGTFLGVWLCMIAYQHAKLGIAITMHSTSPIFVLPLAFFILRQRVSLRAILGAIIAVAGIFLLFEKNG